MKPIIKGLCIAAFLSAINIGGISAPEWWVAMLALNVAFNI